MTDIRDWCLSPHFRRAEFKLNEDLVTTHLFQIRGGLKQLNSSGFSDSCVNQTFRVVIANFWEARLLRFLGQGHLRPWSKAALERWPSAAQEEPPFGMGLVYEHSIPINIVVRALLSDRCDDERLFARTLKRLVVPCVICDYEDTALNSTISGGKKLRDAMPECWRDPARSDPLEWPPEALDSRYEAASAELAKLGHSAIEFPSGCRPSDVARVYS